MPRRRFTAIAASLGVAFFILDRFLPLGVAAGLPYIVLIWFSLWSPRRSDPVLFAAVATALAVLGSVLKPVEGPIWIGIANRAATIVVVWATGILLYQRKNLEAAMRTSEAITRAILDSTVDGIVAIDEQGTIVLFNPSAERIFGYTAEEVLGRSVGVLMPSPHREVHQTYLDRCRRGEGGKSLCLYREVVGQRKSGEVFPLLIAVNETPFDERRLFTGVVRDLTREKHADAERRHLEAELVQARTLENLGRLAGGITHELGNALNVITNYAEVVLKQVSESGEVAGEVRAIRDAARRAAQMTRQLLLSCRQEAGGAEPIDLGETLAVLKGSLAAALGDRSEVVIVTAAGLWRVIIPEFRIEQILLNLASNARDAMPDGGLLTVRAENAIVDGVKGPVRPGRYVHLSVEDTGCGMPEEVRAHAFEPFYTTKGPGRGTGLGLWLVQSAVRASGGQVELTSAPSRGTTIEIWLPAAEGSGPAASACTGANARPILG